MRTRQRIWVGLAFLIAWTQAEPASASATPWSVTLDLTAATSTTASLTFGLDAAGTDGLNEGLGEDDLPPGETPFAAFPVPGTLVGSLIDYRGLSPAGVVTWTVQLGATPADYPIDIAWSLAGFPAAGTIRIRDAASAVFDVNLRAATALQIADDTVTQVRVVYDPNAANLYAPPTVTNPIADRALTAADPATQIDLAPVFTDPDGNPLSYAASTSNNAVATASVSGATLSVTPVAVGTATIAVTASDPNDGVAQTTFSVTVSPAVVNLPPLVTNPIANLSRRETAPPYTRNLTASPVVFSDPNGDVLTYTASSSAAGVATASASGSVLTVTPVAPGTATITVTADDGEAAPVSTTFGVTIIDVTVATPFALDLTVTNALAEDALLRLGLDPTATDGLDVGLGEDELPPLGSGFDARFEVSDLAGLEIDMRHNELIAPQVWTLRVQPGAGGQPIVLDWSPAQLPAAGVIRLRDAAGGAQVDVNMRAQSTLTSSSVTSFVIVYDAAAANLYNPPTVANPIADPATLTAGEAAFVRDLAAAPVFTDPDLDPLTYTATSSDPAVATVSVTGSVLTVTPVSAGTTTIAVTADDGVEGLTTTTFAVAVQAAQVSLPPVVSTPIPNQTLVEGGAAFSRNLTQSPRVFTDPNGDVLTFAAGSSAGAVATAGISGTTLTVTPLAGGVATITVTADDGAEPPVSTTFQVTVLDVTVAPSFVLDLSVASNNGNSQALSLGLDAAATDGLDAGLGEQELPPTGVGFDARFEVTGLNGLADDLRFNQLTAPQGWSLLVQPGTNGLPLTLTWSPAQLPATGVIRLQDSQGGSTVDLNMRARTSWVEGSVTAFRIVYDAAAVNTYDPPVVANPIPNQALTAGDPVLVISLLAGPVFTDPNADPLTFTTTSSANAVATASVSGTDLRVTPVAAGTATIAVTADDGDEGLTSTTFTVTVTAAQQPLPPVVANPIAAQTLVEGGAAYTRNLAQAPEVFTDPNGDPLTYTASSSDDAVATALIAGSTLTVSPAGPGTATITVTADDGAQPPVSTTFGVTVLAVITADAFSLTLNVANAGTGSEALTLGMADGATAGLDPGLGELEAPPLPVTSVFDARLAIAGTLGSLTDLRSRQTTGPVTWSIQVQVGTGGMPLTLTWSPAQLPADGVIRLQDQLGGSAVDLNMRAQASHVEPTVRNFRVVYDAGAANTFSPPVVANPIADQGLTAGDPAFAVDLAAAPVFTDPESDPLSFTAGTSDNSVATASVSGTTLTVTPLAAGTATISVTADDGNEGTTTTSFTVTVVAAQVSLPPVVANPIAAVTLTEGDPDFVRDLAVSPRVFTDPNGDVLTYTASSSAPAVAAASLAGTVLHVTPAAPGTATITVTADDGTEPPVSTTFGVTVLTVVTITPFSLDLTVVNAGAESEVLTFGFAAAATDGIDAALGEVDLPPKPPNTVFDVRFEFGVLSSLIDLRPANAAAAVTFRAALQAGAAGLPFTLSWDPAVLPAAGTMRLQDPLGGASLNLNMRARQTASITDPALSPVFLIYDPTAPNLYNPPTAAGSIPDTTLVAAGTAFVFDLGAAPAVFVDPDGDPLTYTATSASSAVASVSVAGSTLTVSPLSVGQTTIAVTANDGNEGTAQTTFAVTVQAPALNLPPAAFNPLPDLALTVGDPDVAIDLTNPAVFTDPNGDPLTYTAGSANAGVATASLAGTTLTISPVGVGAATITVTADDGQLTASDAFTVTVAAAGPEPQAFTLGLTATDAGTETGTITLGLASGATNGIDAGLGETEQPPLPPAGNYDLRFTGAGLGNGLILDLRAVAETASWSVAFRTGAGGYPIQLTWDASALPPEVHLRMADPFGGVLFSVDMRAQSSFSVTNTAVTSATISYTFVPPVLDYWLPRGWSLVSLPVAVTDGSLAALFPDAIEAYGFAGTYQQATSLDTCMGYWVHLANGGTYTIPGTAVASCANDLAAGWNLVGAPFTGSDFTEIGQSPASVLISAFGWTGLLYQQKLGAMPHGYGYWVHMTTAGTLTLAPPSGAAKPLAAPQWDGATLWVRRADAPEARVELQLGVSPEAVVALPPLAPAGIDARILVGRVESWQAPVARESTTYRLRLQGGPLELGWDVPAAEDGRWSLVVDGAVTPLAGAGSIEVGADALVDLQTVGVLPRAFSLAQNFPNPFNPSTTIRYDLPVDGEASLRLYNAAGQVVRALAEGWHVAGTHSAVWDGRDAAGALAANGVYLCQLRAGRFAATRRLVLMK